MSRLIWVHHALSNNTYTGKIFLQDDNYLHCHYEKILSFNPSFVMFDENDTYNVH